MNKTTILTFIIFITLAIISLLPSKTFAQDAFNNQLTFRDSQLMLAAHNAIGSGTPPEVETMNVEQIAQQFGVSTEEVYAYRDRFDELMELIRESLVANGEFFEGEAELRNRAYEQLQRNLQNACLGIGLNLRYCLPTTS